MRSCTARLTLALTLANVGVGLQVTARNLRRQPPRALLHRLSKAQPPAASAERATRALSREPARYCPKAPSLAIQAGQGVGPIRIGATVATIERLMEAPCEVKTESVCRYIRRAVEFDLDKNGFTERIVVHRHDRPAGPDAQRRTASVRLLQWRHPAGSRPRHDSRRLF